MFARAESKHLAKFLHCIKYIPWGAGEGEHTGRAVRHHRLLVRPLPRPGSEEPTMTTAKARPALQQMHMPGMPARPIDAARPLAQPIADAPRATFGPAIVYRQGIRVTGMPGKRTGPRR